MRHYTTVRATTESDLWHEVNALLARGYQLEGGMCVVVMYGGPVFYQALSRAGGRF